MSGTNQQDSMQEPRQETPPQRGQGEVELPSINADRTAPYPDPIVNQVEQNTYGATEAQVTRGEEVIAPTFSDTEPGAGLNYGAAGDPAAPNLGGIEDETTLGADWVRPPDRRLVHQGEFETDTDTERMEPHFPSATVSSTFAASSGNTGRPATGPNTQPGESDEPAEDRTAGYPGASRENPLAAPGGASPQVPLSPRTKAAPGQGNNLGGEGAHAPRPLPGEATQGVASMTNPTTDRITQKNNPGPLPAGHLTYGNPQAYAGDGEEGRFGTSSGSAGELPGGHMIDLAHGGAAEQPRRTDPDMPGVAPTALDEHEPVLRTENTPNRQAPPDQPTLTP